MDKLWNAHQLPIDEHAVLYQATDGAGMLDNPLAIFEYLIDAPHYAHLRHIWVIPANGEYSPVMMQWRRHSRVSFVSYRSPQYFRALTTTKYLINNTSFPSEFAKRPGQIYVNTWHGVPLKRMGYDMPRGYIDTRNVLRNFVAADYLISACRYMTDVMYRQAYRLDGVFAGSILESGQPRIDTQLAQSAASARDYLRRTGCTVGDGPIVLYMPTWRGGTPQTPSFELDELVSIYETLVAAGRERGYQVLLKVHSFIWRMVGEDPRLLGRIVPNFVPSNIALAAAEVLVTDYSSAFFDFLSLDRPVVHYVPDLDDYADLRGVYLEPDDWPGPKARTLEELANEIGRLARGQDRFAAVRAAWRERFCANDDGHATRRVVEAVFGPAGRDEGHIVTLATNKPKVLIYCGGLLSNGITTALLALLAQLDDSAIDVSVLYDYNHTPLLRRMTGRMPPHVRHFPRIGAMIQQIGDQAGRRLISELGLDAPAPILDRQRANFDREWRRCFGDVEFDHIIDFSGYSAFWPMLLMSSPKATRSIWVHSDLAREIEVGKLGNRPQAATLPGAIATFRGFDNVVSVTEPLQEITRTNFQAAAPETSFVCVQNAIDIDALFTAAGYRSPTGSIPEAAVESMTVDTVLHRAADRYGWPDLSAAFYRVRAQQTWLPDDPEVVTFITAGRLSPEKNHERLIRAFATVHRRYPKTFLLICGDGILRAQLQAMIGNLGLSSSCKLTAHTDQVPALVAKSDCFVFSSDYEGQGLALLEAVVLGKPVVTTRFDAVTSVLQSGGGRIVDLSSDALAAGMIDFIEGRVSVAPFDADAYNRVAIGGFMALVGAAVTAAPDSIASPSE